MIRVTDQRSKNRTVTVPTLLTIGSTALFFMLERLYPGRPLPWLAGWYTQALCINLAQLAITLETGKLWVPIFGEASLLKFSDWQFPVAEGLAAWFLGTFAFYWWHRVRHEKGFWRIFHQIHHSPSRIEILTSFYKHPIEILANSLLSAAILFPLLDARRSVRFGTISLPPPENTFIMPM